MLGKTSTYAVVLASGVLILAGLSVWADNKDDKDKPALSGVWMQTGGQLKIEFADKETMRISPHGDNVAIVIVCQCTLEKERQVKAKVTDFEGKEEFKQKIKEHLPVGFEFSFKWQVQNDTATLGDVKGDKVEHLRMHLEGKYDQKK